jgi:hypothetical protein
MTWIHCSITDGSCVALSEDRNFDSATVSRAMRRNFFHVRCDRSLAELLPLINAVEDANERIIHKHRGYVDIDVVVPVDQRSDIRDPRKEVPPLSQPIVIGQVTQRS